MHTICNFDFKPSALVLIHNPDAKMDKTKPQYYGPMLIIQLTYNGTYCLTELDSMVSKLCYTTFRLLPYHTHSPFFIPVIHIMDCDDLTSVIADDLPIQEEQQAVMMPKNGHI